MDTFWDFFWASNTCIRAQLLQHFNENLCALVLRCEKVLFLIQKQLWTSVLHDRSVDQGIVTRDIVFNGCLLSGSAIQEVVPGVRVYDTLYNAFRRTHMWHRYTLVSVNDIPVHDESILETWILHWLPKVEPASITVGIVGSSGTRASKRRRIHCNDGVLSRSWAWKHIRTAYVEETQRTMRVNATTSEKDPFHISDVMSDARDLYNIYAHPMHASFQTYSGEFDTISDDWVFCFIPKALKPLSGSGRPKILAIKDSNEHGWEIHLLAEGHESNALSMKLHALKVTKIE